MLDAVAAVPQVRREDDLDGITRLLATGEHSAVAVVDHDGRFVGAVNATGVLQALVGVPGDPEPTGAGATGSEGRDEPAAATQALAAPVR